ncbi:hypothetical protein KN815_18485 [Streptomyces sp. 4503]|uniref:Uncharacterized protein n=1 Tax=Streptomyces niphimycinicus TaxID=2842201 RepID=A0ABS6CGJ5_9ACTN|nr:hypothetical protein [Streptomyces niphimycinicus]MBU3865990.1 hypothetical protein [Streptomyces niphimycinicus]
MKITEEHIDAMRSARHRMARAEARAVAELLRQALGRLGFTPDVAMPHGEKDESLFWPVLRGEVTVSGHPLVALGRIPLDSANRLAEILMRAALEEQTKKATTR